MTQRATAWQETSPNHCILPSVTTNPQTAKRPEKPANEIMAAEGLACGLCSCESAASVLAAAPKRAH